METNGGVQNLKTVPMVSPMTEAKPISMSGELHPRSWSQSYNKKWFFFHKTTEQHRKLDN